MSWVRMSDEALNYGKIQSGHNGQNMLAAHNGIYTAGDDDSSLVTGINAKVTTNVPDSDVNGVTTSLGAKADVLINKEVLQPKTASSDVELGAMSPTGSDWSLSCAPSDTVYVPSDDSDDAFAWFSTNNNAELVNAAHQMISMLPLKDEEDENLELRRRNKVVVVATNDGPLAVPAKEAEKADGDGGKMTATDLLEAESLRKSYAMRRPAIKIERTDEEDDVKEEMGEPFLRLRLVNLIRADPDTYIYQSRSSKEMKQLRTAAWNRVADQMGWTVEECKRVWLRVKAATNGDGVATSERVSATALYSSMAFYRDFLRKMPTRIVSVKVEPEAELEQSMQLRKRSGERPSYSSMLKYGEKFYPEKSMRNSLAERKSQDVTSVTSGAKSSLTEKKSEPSDTPDRNVQLLEIMQMWPITFIRGYSHENTREEAWRMVAKKFGASVCACKNRYQSMRKDYYEVTKRHRKRNLTYYTTLKTMLDNIERIKSKAHITSKKYPRGKNFPNRLQQFRSSDTSVTPMETTMTSSSTKNSKKNYHNTRTQANAEQQQPKISPSTNGKSAKLILKKLEDETLPSKQSQGRQTDEATATTVDRMCPDVDQVSASRAEALLKHLEADESGQFSKADEVSASKAETLLKHLVADGSEPFSKEEMLFFQSIALKFRRMDARQRSLLMLKIFNVFHDVEFEAE